MSSSDPALQRAIEAMTVPGLLVEHRLIAAGDDAALLPEEQTAFAASVPKVRRASGAARIVARALMQRLGHAESPVVKSDGGMPRWPAGLVGSLAHDDTVAAAAVAASRDFQAVGIDVEPAMPLDADLVDIVATPAERARLAGDPLAGRLLFSIKEAVYKATYPLDRRFLDHHDVEVDVGAGLAAIRNGRTLPFLHITAPRIVTLAFVRRD